MQCEKELSPSDALIKNTERWQVMVEHRSLFRLKFDII